MKAAAGSPSPSKAMVPNPMVMLPNPIISAPPFSDRRWAPTFVTDLGAALFDVVLDRTVYVIRE